MAPFDRCLGFVSMILLSFDRRCCGTFVIAARSVYPAALEVETIVQCFAT